MRSKPYTLVIANGEPPSAATVRTLAGGAGKIVCADGGANVAARFRIRPDVIVGDLDSLTRRSRRKFASAEILQRTSQYATDLEKALDYCIAKKFREVKIIGAAGKRFDHSLSNVSILRKYHGRLTIRCIEAGGEFFIATKRISLGTIRGQIVSLVPLGSCVGITTRGLMYELRNGTLEVGVSEGQSNVAVASIVTITMRSGSLLVYLKNSFGRKKAKGKKSKEK